MMTVFCFKFLRSTMKLSLTLHPDFNRVSSLYELLLIQLPSSLSDIQSKSASGPLYEIDVSSTPPRLARGNKEFLGRREALRRPFLLIGHESQDLDSTCSLAYVIRERIIFDTGPMYHW
eukprot:Protomagalhaensia_sp_Gyna_25__2584@NODE_246_length_4207_cov_20_933781_g189_i0_p5_GENE_NODE_246_length_4207_cov_20_933781_g189_i0NODE_246_length_4207_cov_20_933781_g189_i0_p5_ORF_typecomplete_len119_score1_72_NODE_246_length_4207_cov_20_933781_g189_i08481204